MLPIDQVFRTVQFRDQTHRARWLRVDRGSFRQFVCRAYRMTPFAIRFVLVCAMDTTVTLETAAMNLLGQAAGLASWR